MDPSQPHVPDLNFLNEKIKVQKAKASSSVLNVSSSNSHSSHSARNRDAILNSPHNSNTTPRKRQNTENLDSPNTERNRPDGKPNWKQYKQEAKALKVARKTCEKGKEEYDVRKEAKYIWEDLRRKDCTTAKKVDLSKALFELVKDKLLEFVRCHDMSRVIETLVKTGTDVIRQAVLNIFMEGETISRQKYANHVVVKAVRSANLEQRKTFCRKFYSRTAELILHPRSQELAETIFMAFPSKNHQYSCMVGLYNYPYALYYRNLPKYANKPDISAEEFATLQPIVKNKFLAVMQEYINKLMALDSFPIRFHVVHMVLLQYFTVVDLEEKKRVIDEVKMLDKITQLLTSSAGITLVMYIFWISTPKERKIIIKGIKGKVYQIACSQYSFLLLITMFDTIDDTKFLAKSLIAELLQNITGCVSSVYGRKVIRYMVEPRNKMDFNCETIALLERGEANPISKKDMVIRRKEIVEAVEDSLLTAVAENVEAWMKDGKCALLIGSILEACRGPKLPAALEAISNNITRNELFETIDARGTFRMAKKLIGYDIKFSVFKEVSDEVDDSTFKDSKEEKMIDRVGKSEAEKEMNRLFTQTLIEKLSTKSLDKWFTFPYACGILVCILAKYENTDVADSILEKIKLSNYEELILNKTHEAQSQMKLKFLLASPRQKTIDENSGLRRNTKLMKKLPAHVDNSTIPHE